MTEPIQVETQTIQYEPTLERPPFDKQKMLEAFKNICPDGIMMSAKEFRQIMTTLGKKDENDPKSRDTRMTHAEVDALMGEVEDENGEFDYVKFVEMASARQ